MYQHLEDLHSSNVFQMTNIWSYKIMYRQNIHSEYKITNGFLCNWVWNVDWYGFRFQIATVLQETAVCEEFQSLRLCASTAGGVGVTPGVVIKVPQAMQHSQNKHAHTHANKETTICGILV